MSPSWAQELRFCVAFSKQPLSVAARDSLTLLPDFEVCLSLAAALCLSAIGGAFSDTASVSVSHWRLVTSGVPPRLRRLRPAGYVRRAPPVASGLRCHRSMGQRAALARRLHRPGPMGVTTRTSGLRTWAPPPPKRGKRRKRQSTVMQTIWYSVLLPQRGWTSAWTVFLPSSLSTIGGLASAQLCINTTATSIRTPRRLA